MTVSQGILIRTKITPSISSFLWLAHHSITPPYSADMQPSGDPDQLDPRTARPRLSVLRKWVRVSLPLYTYVLAAAGAGIGALLLYPMGADPTLIGHTTVNIIQPASAKTASVVFSQDPHSTEVGGVTTLYTVVTVNVAFDSAQSGSIVKVHFFDPVGLTFLGCGDETDNAQTDVASCIPTSGEGDQRSINLSSDIMVTSHVKKSVSYDKKYVRVAVRFAGWPALNVAFGNGRIVAVLPHIEGQSPGTQTVITYVTNTDEAFDWSGRIPDSSRFGILAWLQGYSESIGPAASASGVNHSEQSSKDRRLLLAGTAVGVAGSALIALLQHLYRRS